jgi:hypothetical protein
MTGRHIFTGTAGVYHVMHKLACEGIHASCTHGNAPNVDILVSSGDGSRMVAIEVKTTENALRLRGRGTNKHPHELQFAIGHRAAKLNSPNLLLAFVDLRGYASTPDVYVYPSAVVAAYCAPWIDKVSMARFHVPITTAEPYKNNWQLIRDALAGATPTPTPK